MIIKTLDNPNTAYESFFDIFFKNYDKYSPRVINKIKAKTIQNPWITKGITKFSKKKQKLYERFLKKRTPQCSCQGSIKTQIWLVLDLICNT